jgi:hypothetical protein
MFHQRVSLNPDIKRLVDKGYALKFDGAHLIVRDIPYLNGQGALRQGAIVSKLIYVDEHRISGAEDHQILFAGEHPCELNGAPIANLGGGPTALVLNDKSIVVERSFSNKPAAGFPDLFSKIESYVRIIGGPAMSLHNATPLTFRIDEDVAASPIFRFQDTLSSRAEIGDLAQRLSNDVIAIIGLGGTGSYLLDFAVKSPVKGVRGFDGDLFHVHTAFRSPGRLSEDELGLKKAAVYRERYSNFRRDLALYEKYLDASDEGDLEGVTFAFVCVDKGSSRSRIFDLLMAKGIPFIDVGMGLHRQGEGDALAGMLRVTHYSTERGRALREEGHTEMSDDPNDAYRTNVQISELNALNAALAVVRYKQLRGFYADATLPPHLLMTLASLRIVGKSIG